MTDATVKNPKSEIRNPKLEIGNGFTLTELLVVIGIIVLIASIALPSVVRLFTAGADAQAHNVIAAQLAHARAIAIQNNTYAGVHVQLADAENSTGTAPLNPDLEDTCYAAVVIYDQAADRFSLATGCKPQKIPGSIAFGQLTSTFVSGTGSYQGLNNLGNFTTFTIVFGPLGQVTTRLPVSTSNTNGNVIFANAGLFGDADPAIWNVNNAGGTANNGGQPAVTAITMFDYTELYLRPPETTSDPSREDYLDEAGQFLPINVYTGQLFPRK